LNSLPKALLSANVAARDQNDIDGLLALARADATRTTFIEHLQPVGGGWVLAGSPNPVAAGQGVERPAE
jgi:hypothetical protein